MTVLMGGIETTYSVELLSRGDAGAWEQVVGVYQAALSRYLYNMVRDRELARDLTQDTFLRAYRSISDLDSAPALRPWLYRIATNLALKSLRRRRLIFWVPWSEVSTQREGAVDSGEDALVERETVRCALSGMPAKYRAMLLLHDNQGFGCEDLAIMLGISTEAARKRLTRARRMFRDAYEKLEAR